ncbi:MAG: hypothetical protein HQK65_00005 [Desulfamplus sp.]|nr:hypothetical protein [Desulfamplus sp.]
MGVKICYFPYIFSGLSAFLPILMSITNTTLISHAFNLLIIGFLFVALSVQYNLKFNRTLVGFYLGWVSYYLIVLAFKGEVGLVIFFYLVPITLSFFLMFTCGNPQPTKMMEFQKSIYLVHIAFVFFEIVLLSLGYGDTLEAIIGSRYRRDLGGKLRDLTGMPHGPNSLLLSAQGASHILVMGIVLFLCTESVTKKNIIFVLFLFILFLFSITLAETLILLILLSFWYLWKVPDKYKKLKLLFFISLNLIFAYDLVFWRFYDAGVFNKEFFQLYVEYFMAPVIHLWEIDTIQLVLGMKDSFFVNSDHNIHADFGYGMLFLKQGMIIIMLLFLFYVFFFLKSKKLVLVDVQHKTRFYLCMRKLLLSNLLLSIGWLLTPVHYSLIFFDGGMQLFSLHLASGMWAIKKY